MLIYQTFLKQISRLKIKRLTRKIEMQVRLIIEAKCLINISSHFQFSVYKRYSLGKNLGD